MSYDIKYRQRAVEHWDAGSTKRATAETFKVSPTTLQTWKSQLKETGDLAPKKRKEYWKKIDPEKLRRYVEENPDAYQEEIAEAFGVSKSAIQKALKRLKITHKKNHIV